ncbi:hypothetical protein EPI10_027735 [Gossypium australe]|uniref:Uncharacterized protein n=1 Tax=Gossypium australe TaxID=47621 RepID=A0A5B6UWW1_9ROSI|nr:hypothetical protein EPI10_027735 [Gossypium australe]
MLVSSHAVGNAMTKWMQGLKPLKEMPKKGKATRPESPINELCSRVTSQSIGSYFSFSHTFRFRDTSQCINECGK